VKADTSRTSFDAARHYRSVFRQQGRVDLDADWNEQQEILDHLRTETTADLVGPAGGPASDAGFALSLEEDGDLRVSLGHYYVHGMLAQNEQDTSVWDQPDAPPNSPIVLLEDGSYVSGPTPPAGRYLVFLDLWDLHRTALEDDTVREVALGGPDTTTRVKTVWQVKLLRLGNVGTNANCATNPPLWTELTAEPTGRLEARAEPADDPSGPCIVPAAAGFRGLENQHYRIEIHQGGDAGGATFKWARDNASTVANWVSGPDDEGAITVASPGRDSVTGFAAGMWLELIDDTRELCGDPGTLVQLTNVRGNRLTISPATGISRDDYPLRPRVRRWDSAGARGLGGDWLPIEHGVQVRFTDPGSYPTGTYWQIPARTNLTDILWPRAGDGSPLAVPPTGVRHRFAKLGLASFNGTNWTDLRDCRSLFPHLTQLMQVSAVSGDGQTATPNLASPGTRVLLAESIVVGVSNGSLPVPGATVRFTVIDGTGTINNAAGPQTVVTDAGGQASAAWRVDSTTAVQQVRVDLLNAAGQPFGVPAGFTASLLSAARVAYAPGACPRLADATTVQQALDILCQPPPVDVPRVTGTNWPHAGEISIAQFLAGLQINFDRPIQPPAGDPHAWFRVSLEYDRSDFEADPNEWFVRGINAQQITFSPSRDSVLWRPFGSFQSWAVSNGVARRPICRVVLKSHVLVDDRGVALDGEFLKANFPSGNNSPGGDFESWFVFQART
jgi:hypothetical protein